MATSLADLADAVGPRSPLTLVDGRQVVDMTVAVTVGFVAAGVVAWGVQHLVQPLRSTVRGRVYQWCPGTPALAPLAGGKLVLIGTAGPGANGVYDAGIHGDGTYSTGLPPGIYLAGVVLPNGHQVPPMVLTPATTSGEVPLPSSLELIYDVWGQLLVPQASAIAVDLVVAC